MKKLITQFIYNKKGSGEALGFLATILLLMLVVLSMWPPVKLIFQSMVIENVERITLMEEEESGGFTTDIQSKCIDRLSAFGIDPSRLTVTSTTPQPVQWGDEVNLTIKYVNDYKKYSLEHMALSATNQDVDINISRSSVSRAYFK